MKQIGKLFSAETLQRWFKQYKFVWLLMAAGLCLLAFSSGVEDRGEGVAKSDAAEDDASVEELEKKLGRILSRIEGAGEVSVMLTVKSGTQRILARDLDVSVSGNGQEQTEETVVISGANGDEVVLIGKNYPVFQGALVVCSGGGDARVRLEITEALSALTGLGAGRIVVCKGS